MKKKRKIFSQVRVYDPFDSGTEYLGESIFKRGNGNTGTQLLFFRDFESSVFKSSINLFARASLMPRLSTMF